MEKNSYELRVTKRRLQVAICETGDSLTERTEEEICVYFNPSLIRQNTPPWLFRLS